MSAVHPVARVDDELDLLESLVPLAGLSILELGCGAAKLARDLLRRHPSSRVTGIEVDAVQHAKNLAQPQDGLRFIAAGAQDLPFEDRSFDLALMLKSLHHVPLPLMGQALREAARVLRPGGHLYSSEPIFGGAFNDIVQLYNDEGRVRAAAQGALDDAWMTSGLWEQVDERRFTMPVRYASFEEFEVRMMRPSYADHHLDDALVARVRAAFQPHMTPDGAHFTRLMHVRLLRRTERPLAAA